MPTPDVSLLGRWTPDTTGFCHEESYVVKATNDVFGGPVIILRDGAADCGLHGFLTVPQEYVGTASIKIIWTATATTGTVSFGFGYRSVGGDDSESMDQSSLQEGLLYVQDNAPSSINNRLVVSISLTSANLAAGDTLEYWFVRDNDGTGYTDNMSADVILFDLILHFADA